MLGLTIYHQHLLDGTSYSPYHIPNSPFRISHFQHSSFGRFTRWFWTNQLLWTTCNQLSVIHTPYLLTSVCAPYNTVTLGLYGTLLCSHMTSHMIPHRTRSCTTVSSTSWRMIRSPCVSHSLPTRPYLERYIVTPTTLEVCHDS